MTESLIRSDWISVQPVDTARAVRSAAGPALIDARDRPPLFYDAAGSSSRLFAVLSIASATRC